MPECQKIKNGDLDQYGPESFGRLIFATVGKKCVGLKGLKSRGVCTHEEYSTQINISRNGLRALRLIPIERVKMYVPGLRKYFGSQVHQPYNCRVL